MASCLTRSLSTGRSAVPRLARWAVALLAVAGPMRGLPAQEKLSGEAAQKAEAVKADLSRLASLEREFYQKNRSFTADSRALNFAPASGAKISISYASARTWGANASHPVIAPFVCFIIGSVPVANLRAPSAAADTARADQPFCQDARRGTAASALAEAGAAPQGVTKAPAQKAPARKKEEAAAGAGTQGRAAQQPVAPRQKALAQRRPARARPVVPTVTLPALPAQGDVSAAARARTRAASPVVGGGPVEAVSVPQFTDRLTQIANGALDAVNAKPPELTRDPYESTAEFEARRTQALMQFQRREADYFARNSRTLVVLFPVKSAKYDADREVLDVALDPVPMPTARAFLSDGAGSSLTVTCYTRPIFWCSPDAGMTYEANDLWRVPRAQARELDVLHSPLTIQARFAVGSRDDVAGPSLTLLGLELQAKGQAIARWEVSPAAR